MHVMQRSRARAREPHTGRCLAGALSSCAVATGLGQLGAAHSSSHRNLDRHPGVRSHPVNA